MVSAGNRRRAKARGRRADEHHALGGDARGDARLHERAEREAGQHDRDLAEALSRMRERRERVRGLAYAVVERALGFADTAKVEAHAGIAKREEGLGERLHDLVLERAALLRVRMGDERNPARSGVRGVDHQLQRAGRAFDDQALGSLRRQIRSLSTISPPTTWRSMISSMSARST